LILPSQTKKTSLQLDRINPSEFNNVKIAGIELGDLFDFNARSYEWLKNHKSYPSHLDRKAIHKVILLIDSAQYVDSENQDKNRYILYSAYHIETKYDLYIRKEYFPIMFPALSFMKMWNNGVTHKYEAFKGMMVELHFKKQNQFRYEMKYLAQVRQIEAHHFERLDVFYKEKKYNGDKL
jgi:hypothetical protein